MARACARASSWHQDQAIGPRERIGVRLALHKAASAELPSKLQLLEDTYKDSVDERFELQASIADAGLLTRQVALEMD